MRYQSSKHRLPLPSARRGTQTPAWLTAGFGMAAGLAAAAGFALGRKVTRSWPRHSGHPFKHRLLDTASGMLQRKLPLESINTYLNGFHMYADDMGRQVEATHFCSHLSPDLHQCVIFDSNASDARLIGIEYIISAERFNQLPEDEQRLWHSHHYEIKSGQLMAPGVPEMAEHAYFEDLVTTYGKTFHTWQIDKDNFPYGVPQLMMAFTEDGQADATKIATRDYRLGVSTSQKRRNRESIGTPKVHPLANAWRSGRAVQTTIEEKEFKR